VAGLIAAGGALFAAWLAWSAVRDQIAFEIARDDAARAANQASKINLAKAELTGLKLTGGHVDKILAGFRGVDASSEWNYVDDLRKMNKAGMLSFFSQPLPMPLAGTAGHLSKQISHAGCPDRSDRSRQKPEANGHPTRDFTGASEGMHRT
jgi:hypothetical protein